MFALPFRSYEGWDNPFRPDGEISHEAEELLKQWKRGTAVGETPEVPEDELDNDSKAASTSIMKNGSSSSKARVPKSGGFSRSLFV